MQSKLHAYEIVYTILKEQILNSQLEYGSQLPSVRQLAQQHRVGTKTIKTVLKLLQRDGLIRTRERQRAVVIYQAPFLKKENASVRSIVRKRTAILDIYRTMELLMPEILAFCAKSVSVYELPSYEKAVKWIKRPRLTGSWQLCSNIIHDVLLSSGNFLISSFYASLEIYAEVPFLAEYQRLITGYTPYTELHHADWLLDCLQSDSYTVQRSFAAHYRAVLQTAEKSFDLLTALHPDVRDDGEPAFNWNAGWGWDSLYKKIGRDLVEKIGTGIYSPGTLLPSQSSLGKEYQVSLSTIRKALKVLQSLGFIETINGRGSVVLSHEKWRIHQRSRHPNHRQDTFMFLCGLQLITFLIRPAAALVFDRQDTALEQELQDRFARSPKSCLKEWMDCLLPRVPLYPLKVILGEVTDILNWGYFYSFYTSTSPSMQKLNKLGEHAFLSLQKGDREGCLRDLHEGYMYLFQTIHSSCIQRGESGAGLLKVPQKL
ncbi:GntR family transcriptional regulator [Lactonifactor longoviformis]|uniref:GntR family transcriptional regulator n=1 Tax=Lactonifactor longoviformis TaxID=341220 RepID=UPI0036F3CEFB